jgi:hypothetical protein
MKGSNYKGKTIFGANQYFEIEIERQAWNVPADL